MMAQSRWSSRLLAPRRWLIGVAASLVALGLAACTGSASPSLDPTQRAALADFPAGVGRGYPAAVAEGAAAVAEPGVPAPDFALALADGRHLRLSDLRGRPVVINFWATWCGPCRIEMPELLRAAEADPELVLLAVNLQEEMAAIIPFAEALGMTTPVVLDPAGEVADRFGVRGLPTTVFVGRDGNIHTTYAGILTPAALAERLAEIR
jgi:thiol-disulfide isomerase/thioredoxin